MYQHWGQVFVYHLQQKQFVCAPFTVPCAWKIIISRFACQPKGRLRRGMETDNKVMEESDGKTEDEKVISPFETDLKPEKKKT